MILLAKNSQLTGKKNIQTMTTTWQNKYVKKRSHLFTVGTERTAGLILPEGSRESFTEEAAMEPEEGSDS